MYKSIVSLREVIALGIKLSTEAQQNRKDIQKDVLSFSTREEQWEFVATKLMPEILRAKQYSHCKIAKTRDGGYQFVHKDNPTKRHEGARSFLRDRLSLTTLLAGSGNTSKTVRFKAEQSAKEKALEAYEALSASDRKWFRAQAGW